MRSPEHRRSSSSARLWAIVPVKDMAHAKRRLAGVLPAPMRQQFALTMLEDVLGALAATPGLAGLVVVTRDALAAQTGARYGARILATGAAEGYTQAVDAAVRMLAAEGAAGFLSLPGDVPLARPEEISELIATHAAAPAFSIVPAHDRRGTNAVVCSPPGAVRLAFGEGSFMEHLRLAQEAGIRPRILALKGIGLDIDRPGDLARFAATPSPTRTWAWLHRHGLTASGVAMAMTECAP